MELYLAFNIDEWGSKDLFDYINGADDILKLIPAIVEKPKDDIMTLNNDQQLCLMLHNKIRR